MIKVAQVTEILQKKICKIWNGFTVNYKRQEIKRQNISFPEKKHHFIYWNDSYSKPYSVCVVVCVVVCVCVCMCACVCGCA